MLLKKERSKVPASLKSTCNSSSFLVAVVAATARSTEISLRTPSNDDIISHESRPWRESWMRDSLNMQTASILPPSNGTDESLQDCTYQ